MIYKKPELLNQFRTYYIKNNYLIEEANIFGIRYAVNQHLDLWNDLLGIWTANNCYVWSGTTDPSKYFTENKEGGAAHLFFGFHKNIWQAGIHAQSIPSFAHPALVQTGNAVKIWRDVNKDYDFDLGTDKVETGYFGINFHRASKVNNVETIGQYSAGCQVTRDIKDFEFALNLLLNTDKFKKNKKCTFSYMLFDGTQITI
jgi:hypothetical protein